MSAQCVQSERWWWGAVALGLMVAASPARGAAQTPPDPADSLAPPTTTAIPATDDASSPAWNLFERAVAQRAEGHHGRALALLGRLRLEYPSHPAASRAEQLIRDIEAQVAARQGDTPASQGREGTTNLARAELVTSQALMGTTFGVVPCVIGGCDGARPWVVASLGGVTLGLGLSLLYSRDGITPGASNTMNSAALWGAGFGYLFTGMFGRLYDQDDGYDFYDESDFSPGDGVALGIMLGQLGGLGVGALVNATLQPTSGEAALTSSVGMWSTGVLALMTFAVSSRDYPESWVRGFHVGAAMMAVGGMAVGGYLGHRYDFTRGRVLFMDLGASIGGGLVVALGLLFRGNNLSARGLMGGAAAGIVAGYGLAAYLTRGMRFTPEANVSVSVSPTRGGGVVGLGGRF